MTKLVWFTNIAERFNLKTLTRKSSQIVGQQSFHILTNIEDNGL